MKTKVTLSEELPDNIIISHKKESDDLSQHYLDRKLVVVDNFVSKDEIAILQDSQTQNKNNYDVGGKHTVEGIIGKPSTLFRNAQAGTILANIRDRLGEFSVKRYRLFSNDLASRYFMGDLKYVRDDQFNLRFDTKEKPRRMHMDNYDQEPMRIFLNLDNEARVWRISCPCTYCDACKQKQNCHEIEFGSGALWVVNTKKVNHQLVYGKRLGVFSRFFPLLEEMK